MADDLYGRYPVTKLQSYNVSKDATYEGNEIYQDVLTQQGYTLIDVTGDGHCGFYSILLGKANAGHKVNPSSGRPAAIKYRQAIYTFIKENNIIDTFKSSLQDTQFKAANIFEDNVDDAVTSIYDPDMEKVYKAKQFTTDPNNAQ